MNGEKNGDEVEDSVICKGASIEIYYQASCHAVPTSGWYHAELDFTRARCISEYTRQQGLMTITGPKTYLHVLVGGVQMTEAGGCGDAHGRLSCLG
jgi:aconitase B